MTPTVLESERDLTLIRRFIRSLFIGSRPFHHLKKKLFFPFGKVCSQWPPIIFGPTPARLQASN
jgi:hypothetical protein